MASNGRGAAGIKSRLAAISVCLLACIGGFAASRIQGEIEGYHGAYGPFGSVQLNAPTLKWEVWAVKGQNITSFSMKIDGQAVPASYDPTSHLMTFTPTGAFAPGAHKVTCTAVVEKLLRMSQDWEFDVASDAAAAPVDPNSVQQRILDQVNQLRRMQGLPEAVMNANLAAAAQAHSHYLAVSRSYGHFEAPGSPGYVGNTLGQRLNAFGWTNGGYEDVGFEAHPDTLQTVIDLFAAPYHRIPFLQPGTIKLGAGSEGHRTTIDFGFSEADDLVCSPANEAAEVPSSWDGAESPSPLRLFPGIQGPYGYPIMVAGFGSKFAIAKGQISLVNAAGNPVACLASSPVIDSELRSALLAIPNKPLAKGKYTARAVIYFEDGTSKTMSWTFTVGSQRS